MNVTKTKAPMKITNYESREEWLLDRNGKITATRVKEIFPARGGKTGFYKLLGEHIAIPRSEENRAMRGQRLEEEAIDEFAKEYKKEVCTDLVMWTREDEPRIAISPDGYMRDLTEAVEVKCLEVWRQIEAIEENTIPKDYIPQAIQYFVVNDTLQKLYFVMYNPDMLRSLVVFEMTREEHAEAIERQKSKQYEILEKLDEYIDRYTF